MKRSLSLALSASLLTLSLGPTAPAALAQAVSTVRVAPAAPIVPAMTLPRLATGLTMSPTLLQAAPVPMAASALALIAAPVGSAAPVKPFAKTMAALEAPALETKDMSAGQSSAGAAKDFAARIGADAPVELLVSAPDESAHRLTQTVYPVSLARPGTSLKDIELTLHSQMKGFGIPKDLIAAHGATAVGAVSQINTAVLHAPAGEAAAFIKELQALGFKVQEGRKFEIPKPQQAEPMSRSVGLKEMAAVIGADKLQAELKKVLGEPVVPGQKTSITAKVLSWLGRALDLGFGVENPILPWAVLDSWVSVQHPYLKGHFIKSVTNDDDGESHGTHTSGTVVGMDPWNYAGRNYNIFPNGSATEGDILFKINMAQEDGSLATTNSWGDGSGNPAGAIEKLFVKTAQAGMHHSVSAGNSGSRANTIGGPAIAYANVDLTLFGKVIGVVKRIKAIAASDADKRTASFSSRGPGSPTTSKNPGKYPVVKPDESGVGVNLVAPIPKGSNVPELGGPGGAMSGTSMSNPGVFGGFLLLTRAILVLLKDGLPAGSTAERTQIAMDLARYAMTQTAEKVAPVNEVGDGFVNVWNAFQLAAQVLKDAAPRKAQ